MKKVGRQKDTPGTPSNCKCFLAGTAVLMATGATKDIEDIELGDEVLATDPETGETGPRKVVRLIVTEDDKHFNKLSIATEDGIEKLTATHENPFWAPSEDRWVDAGDLKPGMSLLTDDGDTVIVTANHAYTKRARTYNFTVADLHTYYVLAGETPVLVHNSNGPCGTNLTRGEKVAAAAGVDDLSPALRKNLTGFMKKSPGDAEIPQIIRLPGGQLQGPWKGSGVVRGVSEAGRC
jgi:hypothetical protein